MGAAGARPEKAPGRPRGRARAAAVWRGGRRRRPRGRGRAPGAAGVATTRQGADDRRGGSRVRSQARPRVALARRELAPRRGLWGGASRLVGTRRRVAACARRHASGGVHRTRRVDRGGPRARRRARRRRGATGREERVRGHAERAGAPSKPRRPRPRSRAIRAVGRLAAAPRVPDRGGRGRRFVEGRPRGTAAARARAAPRSSAAADAAGSSSTPTRGTAGVDGRVRCRPTRRRPNRRLLERTGPPG